MSNIRIRSIGIAATAAAGLLLATGAPAYATENNNGNNSAATAAAVRNATDSKTIQTRTRATDSREEVCVRGYQSGTLLRRRICQSQADWDRDGGIPTY